MSASASLVADTPMGSPLANSPASLPTFSSECTHTPTRSRLGRLVMVRIAIDPIPPVAHTTTRCLPAVICSSSITPNLLFCNRSTTSTVLLCDLDGQPGPAPHTGGSRPARVLVVDVPIGPSLEHLLERDPRFQPSQR